MVDAVCAISGCSREALIALSNTDGSPEVLVERLKTLLAEGPAIVFADVRASSCVTVARISCLPVTDPDRTAVVVGVNMPMLLDFVFHRDLALGELVSRLLDRGREGIEAVRP